MDSKGFKESVSRLEEVNAVVSKLDPAIRGEAFSLLKSYVTAGRAVIGDLPPHAFPSTGGGDAEQLFTKYGSAKPAENALLAAAWIYSQYGVQPFSISELRSVAEGAGLTIPNRLDMTIRQAKRSGKALFVRAGQDRYRPTVHGEAFFKSAYGATKGNLPRPKAA